MKVNNVDIERASAFIEEVKTDSTKAIKTKRIEGEWVFDEGRPQFRAVVQHGEQSSAVEADGPIITGGSALKPDPVQYCLFGLAACFAQTFAGIAAERGVVLKKLRVAAENKINLAKSLGLGNQPIVENAKFSVEVSAESGNTAKLEELKQLALERCPGVFCLTNPIRLNVEMMNDG